MLEPSFGPSDFCPTVKSCFRSSAPAGHVSGADEQLGGLMETGEKKTRMRPIKLTMLF